MKKNNKKILNSILSIIAKNKELFIQYNTNKTELMFSQMSKDNKNVILSIPYLLHLNINELPGYIDDTRVPSGIYFFKEYALKNQTVFKKHFSKFKGGFNLNNSDADILNLSIMGSVGTIAQTSTSDFDYWVVLNDEKITDDIQLDLMQKKCSLIEEWAMNSHNIEIHFFIMKLSKVQKNDFGVADEESCGSAQGMLLKDEFFRSSVFVSGMIPIWWTIPNGINNKEYHTIVAIVNKKFGKTDNPYTDFGNIYELEKSEIIGAALWQIVKSFKNPFKSLLKLGLLEEYVFSEKNELQKFSFLLCQQLKENIHNRKFDIRYTDGYILLFNQVYSYYDYLDNIQLLTILETSFYLKVKPQLSKWQNTIDFGKAPIKIQILNELTTYWEWSKALYEEFDNFDKWPVNKINTIGKNINNIIFTSYRKIIKLQSDNKIESKLTPNDKKIIGRKIAVRFSRKKNKIMQLPITFSTKLIENKITFYFNEKGKESFWELYRDNFNFNNTEKNILIYKNKSIINIFLYIAYNKLYNQYLTQAKIIAGKTNVKLFMLTQMLNDLNLFLYKDKYAHIEISNFLEPQYIYRVWLIFNFGNSGTNYINTISFVYRNSWGELFFEEYYSENDLPNILIKIINSYYYKNMPIDKYLNLIISGSSLKLNNRIKNLFDLINNEFIKISPNSNEISIVITLLNNKFLILTYDGTSASYSFVKTYNEIFIFIKKHMRKFLNVKIDPTIKHLSILNVVYSNKIDNTLNIFFIEEENNFNFFIIDEMGIPELITKAKKDANFYLTVLFNFFSNISNKIIKMNKNSPLSKTNKKIRFFNVKKDKLDNSKYDVSELPDSFYDKVKTISSKQRKALVEISIMKNNKKNFIFDIAGESFTSEKYGNKVFAMVTKKILSLRKNSKELYPIFITDVDFVNELSKIDNIQISDFIIYRNYVEEQLNYYLYNQDKIPK